jgi:hypothetical protein
MAYTNIDDPSAYFQVATYTGNGTDNTAITYDGNSDMQPDFLWFKLRSTTGNHVLFDSNRGTSKYVRSNTTAAETTNATLLKSFDSDGFTVGTAGNTNSNGNTLVSWGWKANGGTTSTNTDGSINTTVQANTDAGFSIVGYTCPDPITNFTIGHGLGVTPDVIIVKTRDGSRNWGVYHKSLTAPAANRNLKLNLTNAEAAESTFWANTAPTSSVITIAQNASVNFQGHNYIAYCFAEKQGYSKFGSYVGNGNANGPFIYTGFKPAFFLLKKTSGADGWRLFDNKRAGYNDDNYRLAPDAADAEDTATTYLDILSNGVKIRGTAGSFNQSGGTFIYMAFAENPFVTSTGIPTTAR